MNPEQSRWFPLFANLPECDIRALKDSSQEYEFPKGEIIFEEGTSSNAVFLVMEGEIEIVKSMGTSDERPVAISKMGSILGEMSLFSQQGTHTASARALSIVKLLKIPADRFDALTQHYPKITYNLLQLFTQRLEHSENLTIQDLREKNRQLTQAYHDLQIAQAAIIEKEKIEHELKIAGKMQHEILPESLPLLPGYDFGALMIPAKQVGGDFFDFIALDGSKIGIIVGDVCDKGMPAALFMALTYACLRSEAHRHSDPAETLHAVNRQLVQMNRSDMFVTVFYGILDGNTHAFSYARAGHTLPLLLDRDKCVKQISVKLGQPLGIFTEPGIDEGWFLIPDGGTLLIYSDGLSETIDEHPDALKLSQLCSIILARGLCNAQSLCEQLWQMAGGSSAVSMIKDDFTVVAVKNLTQ